MDLDDIRTVSARPRPVDAAAVDHAEVALGSPVVAVTYDDSAPADVAERVVQELDSRAQG